MWIVGGYLAGSIPFGVIVARAKGVDLRSVGSGNIGATNVTRALGKAWGIVVLLLDAAKGALPVLAARHWLPEVAPYVAFAAVVGHCFPVWLKLRGGKGVATSLGVFLALDPPAIGIALAAFALVFALARMVSLSSLVASLAFVGALFALKRPPTLIGVAIATVLLIVIQHRENLQRIRKGKEPPLS